MRRLLIALIVAGVAAPAAADEIEDALAAALDAYRAGDAALAKEETDYAATLLGELEAEGLAEFLPEPAAGWTREMKEASGSAMFGGGLSAGAAYEGAEGRFEITMVADSPAAAGMAALFANPQMLAAQGDVRRAGRQIYVVQRDGQVMALVANRVLVTASGRAPVEAKVAHFEAIDFRALGAF